MENAQNHSEICECPHHKAIPILVVLLGLVFLLGAINVLTGKVVDIIWPILIIIAGGLKFSEAKCKCC